MDGFTAAQAARLTGTTPSQIAYWARSGLVVPTGRPARYSFRDLVADCEERIEIIVHFLAMLELYKQGFLDVEQISTFGDITVRRVGDAHPFDDAGMADWEVDLTDAELTELDVTEDDVIVLAEAVADEIRMEHS